MLSTASPKVLKIFSHPQTRDQSQVVQNDKLSQESVETKIFVGGNGTFSHFFEKKLKKMWKKISKKIFFFTKICFSELEKAYVQLFVLNFFLSRSWKTSKNRPNSSKLPKIIFCRPKSEKKFKTKSCTYTFLAQKNKF